MTDDTALTPSAPGRDDGSELGALHDRMRLLEAAALCEARVTEAHHEGYSRVAKRVAAQLKAVSDELRGLFTGACGRYGPDAADVTEARARERIALMEDAFRRAADTLDGLADAKSIPSSRRAFLARQPHLLRALADGGPPVDYMSERRYFDHEYRCMMRARDRQPGAGGREPAAPAQVTP